MQVGEFEIGGDSALKTISKLDHAFGDFAGKLGKFGGIFAGSFAAFQGVSLAMNAFKETLDLSGTLQDWHTQTGQAVGDLVILRQAFENAGLGGENTADLLLKLQDSLAGTNELGRSTSGAFQQLGLSVAELRDLPAIQQIEKLGLAFRTLDQDSRVQVAKDLFGKSGAKALSLFADEGALGQARAQASDLAAVMDRNVDNFDKLGDAINGLALNKFEFFAGALEGIAPKAEDISTALASINFVEIGRAVGGLTSIFLNLATTLGSLSPQISWMANEFQKFDFFGLRPKGPPGFAEQFKGISGITDSNRESFALSGALHKSGGGGFGFGGGDPLLTESQRQTRELQNQTRLLTQIASEHRLGPNSHPAI